MTPELLNWVRCPACEADLRLSRSLAAADEHVEHGIVECSDCGFEYPVIGRVLFLRGPHERVDVQQETTARTVTAGPEVASLVHLLKSGNPVLALSRLLRPVGDSGTLFPELRFSDHDSLRRARSPGPGSRRFQRGTRLLAPLSRIYRRALHSRAQLRLARFLDGHGNQLSALDALDLYFKRYSGVETFNYMAFRFGQPRHLAGLSLATVLLDSEGPLLDLACGAGHLTHFFCAARPGQRPVIGLDRDFFRLYVASHYIAPQANFVCCRADGALPFAPATVGSIFCSDAFHYFVNRALSVRELRRILRPDGIMALTRFGNRGVNPNEGYELTPAEYHRLFSSISHVLLTEESLIQSYLQKTGPDLSVSRPSAELNSAKWISAVLSDRTDIFRAHPPLREWPHAAGRLAVNPLYVPKPGHANGNGTLPLTLQFPSEWYRFENAECARYAPERCELSQPIVTALAAGTRLPEMEDPIRNLVLLGLPECYLTARSAS